MVTTFNAEANRLMLFYERRVERCANRFKAVLAQREQIGATPAMNSALAYLLYGVRVFECMRNVKVKNNE